MKKTFYYLSPFIIFPLWALLSELLLDDLWGIPTISYIFIGGLLLLSALIGGLTPSRKNMDLRITLFVPLSFFLTMFIGCFFDTGTCSGEPRLDLGEAFEMSIRFWFIYVLMALITFLASYIRIALGKNKVDLKTIR